MKIYIAGKITGDPDYRENSRRQRTPWRLRATQC